MGKMKLLSTRWAHPTWPVYTPPLMPSVLQAQPPPRSKRSRRGVEPPAEGRLLSNEVAGVGDGLRAGEGLGVGLGDGLLGAGVAGVGTRGEGALGTPSSGTGVGEAAGTPLGGATGVEEGLTKGSGLQGNSADGQEYVAVTPRALGDRKPSCRQNMRCPRFS